MDNLRQGVPGPDERLAELLGLVPCEVAHHPLLQFPDELLVMCEQFAARVGPRRSAGSAARDGCGGCAPVHRTTVLQGPYEIGGRLGGHERVAGLLRRRQSVVSLHPRRRAARRPLLRPVLVRRTGVGRRAQPRQGRPGRTAGVDRPAGLRCADRCRCRLERAEAGLRRHDRGPRCRSRRSVGGHGGRPQPRHHHHRRRRPGGRTPATRQGVGRHPHRHRGGGRPR